MESHALREKCTSINLGEGPDNLSKFHIVNQQSVLGQMRNWQAKVIKYILKCTH